MSLTKSPFTVTTTCFAVSLAVNGAAIFSMDRAFLFGVDESLKKTTLVSVSEQKEKNIEFEFIEAPKKTHPRAPRKTNKIASRDALNQDLSKDKTGTDEISAPKIVVQGPSDQLTQVKQELVPTSIPQEPIERKEETRKSQAPAQEKPKDSLVQEDSIFKPIEKKEDEASVTDNKDQKKQDAQDSAPFNPGLTGQDKITTQEMAKKDSRGAKLYGLTSFEATGSGMGEYIKNMKEKIWLAWFPPIVFKYPVQFRGMDAIIGFTIDRKGDVKILDVIEAGENPTFASYCMEAVQRAGNFGPLPEEILALLGKEEIELKFGFHYR